MTTPRAVYSLTLQWPSFFPAVSDATGNMEVEISPPDPAVRSFGCGDSKVGLVNLLATF